MNTITSRSIRRWQERHGKREPVKRVSVEKRTERIVSRSTSGHHIEYRIWCHPTKGWRNERVTAFA